MIFDKRDKKGAKEYLVGDMAMYLMQNHGISPESAFKYSRKFWDKKKLKQVVGG